MRILEEATFPPEQESGNQGIRVQEYNKDLTSPGGLLYNYQEIFDYGETDMSIYKLYPSLKQNIWGGQRLKSLYKNNEMENIAEAWALSCHKDGVSLVASGEHRGKTFPEMLEILGKDALGTACRDCGEFPLLIKFIDAEDKLSIQVHPDDCYARAYENDSGKTECWYILDAKEDSELIYGFNRDISKQELRAKINDGTLLDAVNRTKVKKGDVVYIPSKTLHAIGAGIFLAEVQQSSNATYRVFDYKRTDKDGKERELHIDKAVDVLDTKKLQADFSAAGKKTLRESCSETLLASSEYFRINLLETDGECTENADEKSFVSLLFLEGRATVECSGESMEAFAGDSFFVSAGSGIYKITGNAKILKSSI